MTRSGLPSVLLRGGTSPNRFGLARRTKVLWQASQHMPYLKMVWILKPLQRRYRPFGKNQGTAEIPRSADLRGQSFHHKINPWLLVEYHIT